MIESPTGGFGGTPGQSQLPPPNSERDSGAQGTPPPQKVDREYLDRFAQLTQREKALARKAQELKASESDLTMFRKLRESKDPDAILRAFDLDYSRVTDHYLKGGTDAQNPVREVVDRLSQLEERTRQQERETLERERDAVRHRAIQEIRSYVESGENYPLIRTTDAYENIYQLCEQYNDAYGKVLTYDEAARMIEDDLKEYFSTKFKPHREASWFKSLLGFDEQASEPPADVRTPLTPPRTLSGMTPQSAPAPQGRRPTDEDLRREALAEISQVFQRRQGKPMW